MEERAPTTNRAPCLPVNYVSLRQLEERQQQQQQQETKEEEVMPMDTKEGEEKDRTTVKRAPRLPPNYISLRQLQEKQQQRKAEEEARKAKQEEDRRLLEMLTREAEKAETEREKGEAEGAGPERGENGQRLKDGVGIGVRYRTQGRWSEGRKGKSARPKGVEQPAGSGPRGAKMPANVGTDPAPVSAEEERPREGCQKTAAPENRQAGRKHGFAKKGRDRSDRRNDRKRIVGVERGEPALESTGKADAAVSANLSSEAAAAMATRLEGALTLLPGMGTKEEAPFPAHTDPLPSRKCRQRNRQNDPMNPHAAGAAATQEGPLVLVREMGMKAEVGSDTPSGRRRARRGGHRNSRKHVPAAKEVDAADEGKSDSERSLGKALLDTGTEASEMSLSNALFGAGTGASNTELGEGRVRFRRDDRSGGGRFGRVRYRGRSSRAGAVDGAMWIRKSPTV